MTKNHTYKVEDIFEDIEDDPEHVNMTIPPEVCEAAGIEAGDTVKITLEGEQLIITKVKENNGQE